MNLFRTVNTHFGVNPEMIRRLAMAMLFSINSSIIGLARRKLALDNKDAGLFNDGTARGDRFTSDSIDANVRDLEMRRAKNNAGSGNTNPHADGGTTDSVLEEQGFDVEDPTVLAEKLVAIRTLLLLETNELIRANHLNPLQDQSIARQILWQLDLPYRENTARITEVVKAAAGRADIDTVRQALRADWDNLQKMRKEAAPHLIVAAEGFLCGDINDTTDEVMTCERYYESHLDSLTKLRILSAAWGKCQKFITVDIPSGKLPAPNMTHEITLVATAMNDLEAEAKELLDDCTAEYITTFIDRGFAGLPVIIQIENAAKAKRLTGVSALMNMSSDTADILQKTNELRNGRKLVSPAAGTPAH